MQRAESLEDAAMAREANRNLALAAARRFRDRATYHTNVAAALREQAARLEMRLKWRPWIRRWERFPETLPTIVHIGPRLSTREALKARARVAWLRLRARVHSRLARGAVVEAEIYERDAEHDGHAARLLRDSAQTARFEADLQRDEDLDRLRRAGL